MKAFVIYLALLTAATLLTGEFHVHRILGMVTVMGILAEIISGFDV